jgi:hypothetical protein
MRYVNRLEEDAVDATAVGCRSNLPRLRECETKYERASFFRHNVNILLRGRSVLNRSGSG